MSDPLQILVVEDEKAIAHMIAMVLGGPASKVARARSGWEALIKIGATTGPQSMWLVHAQASEDRAVDGEAVDFRSIPIQSEGSRFRHYPTIGASRAAHIAPRPAHLISELYVGYQRQAVLGGTRPQS